MFREQWIEPILHGQKVQTVRPPRKIPIVVGDALSLRIRTGLPYASKQKTLIDTHCTSVRDVEIDPGGIVVDGKRLRAEAEERFAARDGFRDVLQMLAFFKNMHGLPFKGVAISWD